MEGMKNAYKILDGKSEEKAKFGRSRRTWENIVKMNLKRIAYEDVNWFHLAQDRVQCRILVNVVMYLQVP
jgi:hypothetical protein